MCDPALCKSWGTSRPGAGMASGCRGSVYDFQVLSGLLVWIARLAGSRTAAARIAYLLHCVSVHPRLDLGTASARALETLPHLHLCWVSSMTHGAFCHCHSRGGGLAHSSVIIVIRSSW